MQDVGNTSLNTEDRGDVTKSYRGHFGPWTFWRAEFYHWNPSPSILWTCPGIHPRSSPSSSCTSECDQPLTTSSKHPDPANPRQVLPVSQSPPRMPVLASPSSKALYYFALPFFHNSLYHNYVCTSSNLWATWGSGSSYQPLYLLLGIRDSLKFWPMLQHGWALKTSC